MLSLRDFSYDLPHELIAQEPARPRDSARLMLIDRTSESITHHHIYDLPSLLGPEWTIVANNTKVFPARLIGRKPTRGKVELLLLKPLGNSEYICISKPGMRGGDTVLFDQDLSATVTHAQSGKREVKVRFNQEEGELSTTLSEIGTMPTPPYIKKMLDNVADYQTIYAKYGFSAAAPTAGLHFTPDLLAAIQNGHAWHELTLNVGLGTFLPVQEDDITAHHMHSESFTITPDTAEAINQSKKGKVLAVGTTTTRALESSVNEQGSIKPYTGDTQIYIYPPYRFRAIDGLLTNLHLPESTLLMMVSAFAAQPNTSKPFTTFTDSLIGRAYQTAVREKYRFFSFGDAMLII